jgi:membrane protein DedA with SNARE-associated domain
MMKTPKFMIYGCIAAIAVNFVLALIGLSNGAYSPVYAQRIGQFFILLVPLVVTFFIVKGIKAARTKNQS